MSLDKSIDKLDVDTQKNVREWLEGKYDEEVKNEIRRLLKDDPKKITDAFYTKLSFGTGGLRGIMGIGSNRMNIYTIRSATQGLANYIRKTPGHGTPAVVIGFDSRHDSKLFAEEAAKVLAGNDIRVYLFSDLRPTPLISFTCRYKKCRGAIMITASHNPPQYNGYKVYWDYGGQVVSPHDQGIIEEVKKVHSLDDIKMADLNHGLISQIKNEMDQAYLEAISNLQLYPDANQMHGEEIKIVYTSLHGTGITLVPHTLAMWGFTNVVYVDEQVIPDGDFPTARSPNPEEQAALKLGIEKLIDTKGDLLLATDPDGDRLGVVVNHQGKMVILDGNEIACICLEHICKALKAQKRMPENSAFIKTIVTTELFAEIVRKYQASCFEVLTGFKYIAELMEEWAQHKNFHFIFGAEESFGYLYGDLCRDKDAVISSALIAEAGLHYKLEKKTLVDFLHDIYRKYGVYRNHMLSVQYPETKEGHEQMRRVLERFRDNPPKSILGTSVVSLEDYLSSKRTYFPSGKTEPISLPKSDALQLHLHDETIITVRPSGTEPKVKLYCGVVSSNTAKLDEAIEHCDTLCKDYLMTVKALMM